MVGNPGAQHSGPGRIRAKRVTGAAVLTSQTAGLGLRRELPDRQHNRVGLLRTERVRKKPEHDLREKVQRDGYRDQGDMNRVAA